MSSAKSHRVLLASRETKVMGHEYLGMAVITTEPGISKLQRLTGQCEMLTFMGANVRANACAFPSKLLTLTSVETLGR